jgi:hypothetical protein
MESTNQLQKEKLTQACQTDKLSRSIFGDKAAKFRIEIEKSREIVDKIRSEGHFKPKTSFFEQQLLNNFK